MGKFPYNQWLGETRAGEFGAVIQLGRERPA